MLPSVSEPSLPSLPSRQFAGGTQKPQTPLES